MDISLRVLVLLTDDFITLFRDCCSDMWSTANGTGTGSATRTFAPTPMSIYSFGGISILLARYLEL